MIDMAPRKRKSNKAVLDEDESSIAINLDDETNEEAGLEKPAKSEKIKENINKVKTKEGIIGYIHRDSNSASIDLKDPTKIIDYAVLSSSASEASEELSNTFEIGDVQHVLVEGNAVKLLSFTVENTKISVFMEKKVDHKLIYKDLMG